MSRSWVSIYLLLYLIIPSETDLSFWCFELGRLVLVGSRSRDSVRFVFDPGVFGDGVTSTAFQPGIIIIFELLIGLKLVDSILQAQGLGLSPAISAFNQFLLIF